MEFTKRVFRSGEKSYSMVITIPSDLIKYYDIKEGDFVTFDLKSVKKK